MACNSCGISKAFTNKRMANMNFIDSKKLGEIITVWLILLYSYSVIFDGNSSLYLISTTILFFCYTSVFFGIVKTKVLHLHIYIIGFLLLGAITNVTSDNYVESFFKILIFSIILIVLISNIELIISIEPNVSYSKKIFFIILIGGLLILTLILPELRRGVGAIRMSAGLNPNIFAMMLFFLFVIVFNFYKRDKIRVLTLLLLFACIIWTMSRSVILSVFILLMLSYFLEKIRVMVNIITGRKGIAKPKLNFYTFFIGICVVSIVFYGFNYIINDGYFLNFIETRFSVGDDKNLNSREYAWQHLLSFYEINPLIGGLGFYEASDEMSRYSSLYNSEQLELVATSPHSLYVRLLSESGLIGLIYVLILPVSLCLFSGYKLCKNIYLKDEYNKFSMIFCSTVSIFSREIVEDSFFTSYISLTTILFFTITISYNYNFVNSSERP